MFLKKCVKHQSSKFFDVVSQILSSFLDCLFCSCFFRCRDQYDGRKIIKWARMGVAAGYDMRICAEWNSKNVGQCVVLVVNANDCFNCILFFGFRLILRTISEKKNVLLVPIRKKKPNLCLRSKSNALRGLANCKLLMLSTP